MKQSEKPKLSKTLFWDTDFDSVDFQKHSKKIIERVISRGTIEDWFAIKRYYGLEKIKTEVLEIRYLDKLTLNFCSKYFDIPKEKFRCYNIKQSIQELWNY